MNTQERTLVLILAYVYAQHHAWRKAETLYASLLVFNPHDSEAAKGLAHVKIAAGHARTAIDVLDGIVGPGEPGAVVQLLRALALVRLDRLDDARVAMRAFHALRTPMPPTKSP